MVLHMLTSVIPFVYIGFMFVCTYLGIAFKNAFIVSHAYIQKEGKSWKKEHKIKIKSSS